MTQVAIPKSRSTGLKLAIVWSSGIAYCVAIPKSRSTGLKHQPTFKQP